MIRSGKHYPVGSKFSRRRAARIGWPHLPRREDAAASPSAGAGLVSSVWHRHSDSMRQLLRHWSAFARPHIRGSDLFRPEEIGATFLPGARTTDARRGLAYPLLALKRVDASATVASRWRQSIEKASSTEKRRRVCGAARSL